MSTLHVEKTASVRIRGKRLVRDEGRSSQRKQQIKWLDLFRFQTQFCVIKKINRSKFGGRQTNTSNKCWSSCVGNKWQRDKKGDKAKRKASRQAVSQAVSQSVSQAKISNCQAKSGFEPKSTESKFGVLTVTPYRLCDAHCASKQHAALHFISLVGLDLLAGR